MSTHGQNCKFYEEEKIYKKENLMTSLKRYDPDIVVRKRLEKMMTDMVDRKPLRKAQLLKIKEQTTSIFKMDPEFLPKQESKKFNSAFEKKFVVGLGTTGSVLV